MINGEKQIAEPTLGTHDVVKVLICYIFYKNVLIGGHRKVSGEKKTLP
jgi:hypothetical protein